MEGKNKGRSWSSPDAEKILSAGNELEKALIVENVCKSIDFERQPGEVTKNDRDNAVRNLRFLRFWHDLPPVVFFSAVSYLDQFLLRIRVQSKYLMCLSMSCFYVSAQIHGINLNPSHLITLSESRFTVKDLLRMSNIVKEKLKSYEGQTDSFDFLLIYLQIFRSIAIKFKFESFLNRMLDEDKLCKKLEIILCDSSCAIFRPSVLSLCLIQVEMDQFFRKDLGKKSNYSPKELFYALALMIELQYLSKISPEDQHSCLCNVKNVLQEYEQEKRSQSYNRLKWFFSASTIALSKYAFNFNPILKTVQEI